MPSTRLMLRRGESGSDAMPRGYRRLEYVQTTGAARLNTLLQLGASPVKTVIRGCCTGYGSTSYFRMVAAVSTNYQGLRVGFLQNSNNFGISADNKFSSGARFLDPFTLSITWRQTGCTAVCGNETISQTRTAYTGTAPITIPSGTSGAQTGAPMLIYRVQSFSDTGDELQNFIPALEEATNKVGFLEMLTGVFHESYSDTPFTAGPEI